MSAILEKYKITFYTKHFGDSVYAVAKSEILECNILCFYLFEFNNSRRIQDLIQQVDTILDEMPDAETGAETSAAIVEINKSTTKFWNWDDNIPISPIYSLPTTDFKALLLAWKSFVEEKYVKDWP